MQNKKEFPQDKLDLNENNLNSSASNIESLNSESTFDLIGLKNTFNRRRSLFIFSFSVLFTMLLISLGYKRIYNPIYKGFFTLLINDPMSSSMDKRGFGNSENKFENIAISSSSNDLPTLIHFLKSPYLIKPIAERHNTSTGNLINRLDINVGGNRYRAAKGILEVSITSGKPKKDILLLQDISKTYLKVALDQRQQRLSDGLNFLNNQTPSLREKSQQLQSQLSKFRSKYSLIAPLSEGKSLKLKESKLDESISELRVIRDEIKNIKKEVSENPFSANDFKEEMFSITKQSDFSVEDNLGKNTLNQALLLEEELIKAKGIYTPNSSVIKNLEKNLKDLDKSLTEAQLKQLDLALKLNKNRIDSFSLQKKELQNQFLIQPELIKKYNNLQDKLALAQKNLLGVNTAKENFQLQMAQSNVPWRIISEPQMLNIPIEPKIKNNLIYHLLIASFFSFVIIFIRDRFDYFYFNSKEALDELKIPSLANIPYLSFFEGFRESKGLLLEKIDDLIEKSSSDNESKKKFKYELFAYQESFRSLFTSLKFLDTDNHLKVISITSSIPAEGKTLINILLAKTLSEMGLKILLIDGDMRKPQVHKRLGLNNLRGFSNLLVDSKLKFTDVEQKVDGNENWSVISSGTLPPDPIRLLSSNKLKILLDNIKSSNNYDLIIIDTPPLIGLSDTLLISEFVDGLVLLVSIGKVPKNLPKESIKKLNSSNSNLLGIVTNTIAFENLRSSSYGYGGYSYGGYSYGGYEYSYAKSYVEDEENNNESNGINEIEGNLFNKYKTKTFELLKKIIKLIDK